ncbi:hypothetical protein pVco7_gp032 [Vibrio phage pVco-7]|uniref:Uncharacterized protein n=1 Tax=Vibrio phage pVco-5 TaxID=1965485 RepID=A0A1W6JUS5_9CAUD|nr:hypothetical protein KNT61_gp033 [Vibrio phage pVco-5]ARM71021.1 hypothetical protein pVco5_033 [Vibrio phage pVco-5]
MIVVTTYLSSYDKLHKPNACVHWDYKGKGYGLCHNSNTKLFVSTPTINKLLKDDEHYAPIKDILHNS